MANIEINVRPETSEDYRAVEWLTREAFWNLHVPGCDEHLVAHKLRGSAAFIPQLDFVAESEGRLVGNIMYSHAKVVDKQGGEHAVICFGPLSVLPAYQGQGVGEALVRHSLAKAAELGYSAVIIYGAPGYYSRFGFEKAEDYKITTAEGKCIDALQVLPLKKDALAGVRGRFVEDEVFQLCEEETEAFEKTFPPKMKRVTLSQHAFQAILKTLHDPDPEDE